MVRAVALQSSKTAILVGNLARRCQQQKFYSEFQIYLFILFVVDHVLKVGYLMYNLLLPLVVRPGACMRLVEEEVGF